MRNSDQPTWTKDIVALATPPLSEDRNCDVAIVGGGLAGVFSAYLLAKSGKKVILLEQDKLGSGATSYTTAFITQDVDTDLEELTELFGERNAQLVWQSGQDAIGLIEKIITEEQIECEFMRTDMTVYANSKKELTELEKKQQKERELGFSVSDVYKKHELAFANMGFYKIENQAKFHPLKFLFGLADKAQELGVEIYEQSPVTGIEHKQDQVIVHTENSDVIANDVVIATYQPFHNRIRLFLKRGMYKSFMLEAKLPKNVLPEGLYEDMSNPYHYFRIDAFEDHDRMILGGEDIKTIIKMDDSKNFRALEDYFKQILPDNEYEITRNWTGQVLEPSDGLPLIGSTEKHEFVASAFSGNGMTYSAIAAIIFTDLIWGKENVYASIYDPKRIPSIKQLFIKGSDYVEEFLGGAAKNIIKKKSESAT